jgi:hypothetical protein
MINHNGDIYVNMGDTVGFNEIIGSECDYHGILHSDISPPTKNRDNWGCFNQPIMGYNDDMNGNIQYPLVI